VGVQVESQPFRELRLVVAHVVVGDTRETMLPQRRGDAVGIGTAHLVRLDVLARLHQFVAGGNHRDHGLHADAHARHACAGRDGHFRRREARARRQQQRALAAVGAAAMHVLPGRHGLAANLCELAITLQLLHGHHGVAARGNMAPVMISMQLARSAASRRITRGLRAATRRRPAFSAAPR
jgi:hypothetical protein